MRLRSAVMSALIFLSALLSACRGGRPDITPTLARRLGCNYNAVLEAYGRLHTDLSGGAAYVPEPGWTPCRTLAYVGAPDSVRRSPAEMVWFYPAPRQRLIESVRARRVHFDSATGSGWTVSLVSW